MGRLNSEAFRTFRSADSRGSGGSGGVGGAGGLGGLGANGGSGAGGGGGELGTVHQNTITRVKAYEKGADGDVVKVSTSGVDGRLVIWSVVGAGSGGIAGRMGRLGI